MTMDMTGMNRYQKPKKLLIFNYNFLARRFFSTGMNLYQKPKKLLILSLIFLRK
jgi:hypothetical protein